MQVINVAANHFSDCPSANAIHPTMDRQVNAAKNTPQQTIAAIRAHEKPRPSKTPQTIESPPQMPPEINAVLAAGLKPMAALFGSYITATKPAPIRNRP